MTLYIEVSSNQNNLAQHWVWVWQLCLSQLHNLYDKILPAFEEKKRKFFTQTSQSLLTFVTMEWEHMKYTQREWHSNQDGWIIYPQIPKGSESTASIVESSFFQRIAIALLLFVWLEFDIGSITHCCCVLFFVDDTSIRMALSSNEDSENFQTGNRVFQWASKSMKFIGEHFQLSL